jgi:hypothetical protein
MKKAWVLAATVASGILVVFCALAVPAGAKDNDKAKPGAQLVDSGSFGVFVKGQRVVTETFSVRQENGASTVASQLKETAGANPTSQKAELQMSASGELIQYEWSETSPASSSLVVVPKDEFLIEKITTAPNGKTAEQPFLMPNTSAILDNNFFVHREVLAWRYLATNCHTISGEFRCQKEPGEYGVLVPQDRASLRVRLELVGREKVTIRGAERELMRLNLSGEGFSWALWVDEKDQFKLIRLVIADDNTEVVRD